MTSLLLGVRERTICWQWASSCVTRRIGWATATLACSPPTTTTTTSTTIPYTTTAVLYWHTADTGSSHAEVVYRTAQLITMITWQHARCHCGAYRVSDSNILSVPSGLAEELPKDLSKDDTIGSIRLSLQRPDQAVFVSFPIGVNMSFMSCSSYHLCFASMISPNSIESTFEH